MAAAAVAPPPPPCEYCGAVFGNEENGYLPTIRMPCCDRNYHGFCLVHVSAKSPPDDDRREEEEEETTTTCVGCRRPLSAETVEAIRVAADLPVKCAVCLEKFHPSDEAPKLTSCRHLFHSICVLEWTTKADDDNAAAGCPLCRLPVVVPDEVRRHYERVKVASVLRGFLASRRCPFECRRVVRGVLSAMNCARGEAAASSERTEGGRMEEEEEEGGRPTTTITPNHQHFSSSSSLLFPAAAAAADDDRPESSSSDDSTAEEDDDKIWEYVLNFLPPRYELYRRAIYEKFKKAHECDVHCEIPPVCAKIRWEAAGYDSSGSSSSRNRRWRTRNGIFEE